MTHTEFLPRSGLPSFVPSNSRARTTRLYLRKRWVSHITVRISLEGTHIPVWRRIRLDATLPLAALHDVIQSAFGWEDSHLHEFSVGPAYSGGKVFIPAEDFAHRDVVGTAVPEEEVAVGLLLGSVGDRLTYLYDFGDDWIHHIEVELSTTLHPTSLRRSASMDATWRPTKIPADRGAGRTRSRPALTRITRNTPRSGNGSAFSQVSNSIRHRSIATGSTGPSRRCSRRKSV